MKPTQAQDIESKDFGMWKSLRLLCFAAISCGLLKFTEVSAWTYHNNTDTLTWNDTYTWCKKHYTGLVIIQNKAESSFLMNNIPSAEGHYWIGIQKINGIWKQVETNKSIPKEEQNWAQGEPNNKFKAQNCVEMYIGRSTDDGMWNDENCNKKKRALCYQASCQPLSCNQRGECMETIGNYTCDCWPGFYGANCENAVSCMTLQRLEHGQINCTGAFGKMKFSSICNISCEEGFELKGSSSLLCQNSSEWSEPTPACLATSCKALQSPEHGQINCSDVFGKFQYESICNFSCKEGYELKGSTSLLCLKSGEWSESTPTCLATSCKALQSPEHGEINCSDVFGDFQYESVCNFTCKEGYELKGSTSLLCLNSGEWSESLPTCLAQNIPPAKQHLLNTVGYSLAAVGLISGILIVYAIYRYRKKRSHSLLKTDKHPVNTFDNPAFEDKDIYSFDL
ncbi:P-selectin-like isoform X2 [Mixophyes fleayi]|uniref:P-selectin-like isoform X2 n=1 Tax=Mixophyes fleayi TaxID=3061075 RepID=UPI003F4DF23D